MIRPALLSDLAAINAFDIFAGSRLLEIVDNHMLVVEVDDQVVGYAAWAPRGFVGRDYITYLGVTPSHQRRGFGRALLRAVVAEIGPGRVFVSTAENNHTMLALLPVENWIRAGTVAGANEGDRAEVFFYKDHGADEWTETAS
jgi:ribosomal protein S18 acetylase RimI-like enzyme